MGALAVSVSFAPDSPAQRPVAAIVPSQTDTAVVNAFTRYAVQLQSVSNKPRSAFTERELYNFNLSLQRLQRALTERLLGVSPTNGTADTNGAISSLRRCTLFSETMTIPQHGCRIDFRVSYPPAVDDEIKLKAVRFAFADDIVACRWDFSLSVDAFKCAAGSDTTAFVEGDILEFSGQFRDGLLFPVVNSLQYLWFANPKVASPADAKKKDALQRTFKQTGGYPVVALPAGHAKQTGLAIEASVDSKNAARKSFEGTRLSPAQVLSVTVLPMPMPSRVLSFTLFATFDVDERGKATLISFNSSGDATYDRRIRETLSAYRFRPAMRPDGTPVRDTLSVTIFQPSPTTMDGTSPSGLTADKDIAERLKIPDLTPDIDFSKKLGFETEGPDRSKSDSIECNFSEGVSQLSRGLSPEYPEILLSAGVEGNVVAQFVVDILGRVERGSLRVVRSDHDLFTASVRTFLFSSTLVFSPALCDGVRVRQTVQQSFHFNRKR